MVLWLITAIFLATSLENIEGNVYEVEHRISSRFLNEDRLLTIYLPDGYHDSKASYPVLYILDGQNRTADTLTITRFLLERNQIPPLILVSIPHTGNRKSDYYPFKAETGAVNPGAKSFGSFLAEEVVPFMDHRFRTKPHRLILGHSAAGVFVLHTLISHPDLFRLRMAFSPSLHHNPKLVDVLKNKIDQIKSQNSRIYLNIGLMEFEPIRAQFERLRHLFSEHEDLTGLRITFQEFPHDGHSTTPFVGVYSALKAQYVQMRPSLEQLESLLAKDGLVAYFDQLSRAFGYPVEPNYRNLAGNWFYFYFHKNDAATAAKIKRAIKHYHPQSLHPGDAQFVSHWDENGVTVPYPANAPKPREAFLNQFGYAFLEQKRTSEAVYILECNTRFYPQSANAFDSLGEAFEQAGQPSEALSAYRQAVALAKIQNDDRLDQFRARLKRVEQKQSDVPR